MKRCHTTKIYHIKSKKATIQSDSVNTVWLYYQKLLIDPYIKKKENTAGEFSVVDVFTFEKNSNPKPNKQAPQAVIE